MKGLREGAEDYIVKAPFEILELLVRIEKILERCHKKEDEIHMGGVIIYPRERRVVRDGGEVVLKPMEFDCMMLFVKNKNIALTRDQILNELWGIRFEGENQNRGCPCGQNPPKNWGGRISSGQFPESVTGWR